MKLIVNKINGRKDLKDLDKRFSFMYELCDNDERLFITKIDKLFIESVPYEANLLTDMIILVGNNG